MSHQVTAPADKRFRRAHVKPGRRRRWYAVLLPVLRNAVITAVALFCVYYSATAVTHASVLAIDDIAVSGNHHLATTEILGLLGGLKGENLILTDLAAWREQLIASPWIKDATFKRSLPSSVRISVQEKVPIGLGRIRGRLYLVDDRGEVIDRYGPSYAEFDLPIVDGLSSESPREGENDARASLAAQVLLAVHGAPDVAKLVSQVDVSDAHNAVVILDGDPALLYLGTERFVPRLRSYLELGPAMKEQVSEIDYVDLRFENHIYVRPTGTTGAGGAAATGRGKAATAPKGGRDTKRPPPRTQR
jgi:cell division protein FtsQ